MSAMKFEPTENYQAVATTDRGYYVLTQVRHEGRWQWELEASGHAVGSEVALYYRPTAAEAIALAKGIDAERSEQ
jgi:hypothetical protein